MQRMISKLMVAVLMMASVPAYASLGQSVQNGARTVLQLIGNNSGKISVACAAISALYALSAYSPVKKILEKRIEEFKNKNKNPGITELEMTQNYKEIVNLEDTRDSLPLLLTVFAIAKGLIYSGIVYGSAKACEWVGSKI